MDELTITDPIKIFEVTNQIYKGDLQKMYTNFVESIISSNSIENTTILFKSDDNDLVIPFKLEKHNIEIFISELKRNLEKLEFYELLQMLKQADI